MNVKDAEDTLRESDEAYYLKVIRYGFLFLQSNALYLLILSLICYLWRNKIVNILKSWKRNRKDSFEDIDPVIYKAREEARKAAVQKSQELYNKQILKMKIIEKEKEEKKRQEFILRNPALPGRRLNEKYSPLMGSGGSSYRPSRRSCPGHSCNQ